MGKKKTETKQSNKPIYSGQIEGAAQAQNAAYARQQPAINNYADQLTEVSGGLLDRFNEGDPTIDAAKGYVTDTLAMNPGDNPYLNDMVASTNSNLLDTIRTRMGTRGGLGGSDELGIVADELSQNELGLRYDDYDRTMGRQAQAAGMAPGLLAGELIPLDAAMKTGSQGAMLPINAALANSAGIGGLLGQYQDVEGEQTQEGGFWEGLLGKALGTGASFASGGIF